jgi:hypothetical protein
VQFGVADFENWLAKLACEKSLKHFAADCVSDAQKIQRAESHAITVASLYRLFNQGMPGGGQ